MTTPKEFNDWLKKPEGLNLEFKEAKNQFNESKDLPDYCAALSNEHGGKLILGVSNSGHIVGTKAFQGTHNKLSHELLTKLKIRVDVEEVYQLEKRILIFHIPTREPGTVVKSAGKYKYPMRVGDSLVEMDTTTLKKILNETTPDFSSQIVHGLILSDLDVEAVSNFRKKWAEKSKRIDFLEFPYDKMLRSIGLLSDQGINYAGLILFGKKEKLDSVLPCSEIIFEWRQDPAKTSYDFRQNWREPFFKIYDQVWGMIDVRNLQYPFQDGLFQRSIPAFSEKSIRESILNAVAHRDYSIRGQSIFIKASPKEFSIESPGGFPSDITPENILRKTYWRNRDIAETFEKTGLVERSGQGMDDIFSNTIIEGKGLPDLSKSDAFSVHLRIPAQVKDKDFVLFLEKITKEKQILLSFEEIYELEKIREHERIDDITFKKKFLELGIIEPVGRTSGAKYILSHNYYAHKGKIGTYTRLTGLSREQKKELILNHLKKNKKGLMKDFRDAFQDMNRIDINNLLQEMKRDGKISHIGSKRAGYWVIKKSS